MWRFDLIFSQTLTGSTDSILPSIRDLPGFEAFNKVYTFAKGLLILRSHQWLLISWHLTCCMQEPILFEWTRSVSWILMYFSSIILTMLDHQGFAFHDDKKIQQLASYWYGGTTLYINTYVFFFKAIQLLVIISIATNFLQYNIAVSLIPAVCWLIVT